MAEDISLGTVERQGENISIRFERLYPRPVAAVWSALTEPARLADWMGRSYVEPYVGGRYETMLDGQKPMRGRIRIWEPPTLLEYDWHSDHAPNSVARWQLHPTSTGTMLVFAQHGVPYANSNLMVPGWHVYLDHLYAQLDGTPAEDWQASWREWQEIYARQYGLETLTREP